MGPYAPRCRCVEVKAMLTNEGLGGGHRCNDGSLTWRRCHASRTEVFHPEILISWSYELAEVYRDRPAESPARLLRTHSPPGVSSGKAT